MEEDIKVFKEAGADGVVFGLLERSGKVDLERTERLAKVAHPMQGPHNPTSMMGRL
ncbi:uncharacterized protein BXZ73DRAFT_101424 [Epithele typhae]|uniref:uncharacterized protein n=1 Tax=Epithele typhae TaxID=378194 RepID=UPI002007ABCD|nr:uncharacterized protein BXZ73DRAFT_101424 [Epithele typhae]KAH9932049.1 hypothetical protein BXZ73DRAFT_101424 [Epithele typhae]